MTTGTIIGWHLGQVGPQLAALLPGWRYVAVPNPQAAWDRPRPAGPVVLVGYSLGCVGLRETLRGDITTPTAVVTIDGTHSQKGKGAHVHPSHLAIWRPLAERARRGEILWLATTLGNHRYVERMGDESFASTGKVLERALDLGDGALRTPQTILEGALYVRSYPSQDTDKPAHAAQVREVLPELWRVVVVPFLRGKDQVEPAAHDTEPAPPLAWDAHLDGTERLGLRCLAWLGYQVGLDPREIAGSRHDDRILAYSQHCRRGGTFLGVGATGGPIWHGGSPLPLGRDEDGWCAAAQSSCLLGALRVGDAPPHGLRVSVRELVEDARGTGAMRGLDYVPRPGDLGVDARAGGDPLKGGTGHVWRVLQVEDGLALGAGGNEGNRWQVSWRPLRAPERRGWIAYP